MTSVPGKPGQSFSWIAVVAIVAVILAVLAVFMSLFVILHVRSQLTLLQQYQDLSLQLAERQSTPPAAVQKQAPPATERQGMLGSDH